MSTDLLGTNLLGKQQLALTTGALALGYWLYRRATTNVKVPGYGTDLPLLYYVYAIKALTNSEEIISRFYKKHPIFKIPDLSYWVVYVSGQYTEELRKAPDEVLSFHERVNETLQIRNLLGPAVADNAWHVQTIKGTLVRNIGELFFDLQEEIGASFDSEWKASGTEWTKLVLQPSLRRIVSRVSNRAFVGRPLCQDPGWRDLNVELTIDIATVTSLINLFPSWLHSPLSRLMSTVHKKLDLAVTYLAPVIEERRQLPREERPNDMLTWFMDEAPEDEKNDARALTLRILTVNFAAIHTTSMTLTSAIHFLLFAPESVEQLRQEAQSVTDQHGWTKTAMQNLVKLDSFLRETQRFVGLGTVSMSRLALQPFTFSDGTYIPAGTRLTTVSRAVHLDPDVYQDAKEFKPFRFSDARKEAIEKGAKDQGTTAKFQMVTTGPDNLTFGHGKHACPGRFFAANELKCMLAHLLLNFDLKWADPNVPEKGYRPPDFSIGTSSAPNEKAEILVRKRVVKGQ